MLRSFPSPVRRVAATVALVAVAGAGALVAAPVASADEPTPVVAAAQAVDPTAGPAVDPAPVQSTVADPVGVAQAAAASAAAAPAGPVAPATPPAVSPLPDGPVTFAVGSRPITLAPKAAQLVQTLEGFWLTQQGRLYTYDSHGRLVVAPKICDPSKTARQNRGCVPAGPRLG